MRSKAKAFLVQFVKHRARREREPSHFNKEALLVDEMDDKILLAAFYNGVNSDLFIHKLYDKEPQTMVELIHLAKSFMNAEDAIIAKKKRKVTDWKMVIYTIQSKVLIQRKPK